MQRQETGLLQIEDLRAAQIVENLIVICARQGVQLRGSMLLAGGSSVFNFVGKGVFPRCTIDPLSPSSRASSANGDPHMSPASTAPRWSGSRIFKIKYKKGESKQKETGKLIDTKMTTASTRLAADSFLPHRQVQEQKERGVFRPAACLALPYMRLILFRVVSSQKRWTTADLDRRTLHITMSVKNCKEAAKKKVRETESKGCPFASVSPLCAKLWPRDEGKTVPSRVLRLLSKFPGLPVFISCPPV